jgi:hypothetical protein
MSVLLGKPIPERSRGKLEKKWGEESWSALQLLVSRLDAWRFDGPLSLKEAGFLSFLHDPAESIRVVASVSRCGADEFGHGLFDVVLTFWSSTIFRCTTEADPWYPVGAGYESWHQGYVACLVARLSHLKWASAESIRNPAWPMSSGGVQDCLADLESFVLPHVKSLRTDEDLAALLACAMKYRRPPWVRSDPPGMRNPLSGREQGAASPPGSNLAICITLN